MKRRGNSCTIRVFFLKRETLFSIFLSYLYLPILSTFYSLLKRSTWVLTIKSPAACSSYNLRNMTEYKARCQVIIFQFLDLSIVGVLFGDWRRENMPTWHCGMWVGDSTIAWWTTLEQWEGHQKYCKWYTCLWSGSTCTQLIRGVLIATDLRKLLSPFCECLSTMLDAYLTFFPR